ncbi:kinase-like domain-containing protein, partial [Pelagophyceae sp. CCMP2097]
GEGAYGEVVAATHHWTGERRAVKKLKSLQDEDDEMARYAVLTAERELRMFQMLAEPEKHPSIIDLKDHWTDEHVGGSGAVLNTPVLVFELAEMTLLEAMDRFGPFPAAAAKSLAKQLLAALAHAHGKNIVHRDLKPENVLLVYDDATDRLKGVAPLRLKLCDFGAGRFLDDVDGGSFDSDALTHYVGSRWYRAPEMMAASTSYGLEADVWSAACIIAELATGEPLFPGEDE